MVLRAREARDAADLVPDRTLAPETTAATTTDPAPPREAEEAIATTLALAPAPEAVTPPDAIAPPADPLDVIALSPTLLVATVLLLALRVARPLPSK